MYLKELKQKNAYPKYLYLDQNFWIYLGQVHYGKSKDLTLSRILTKLNQAVDEEKLMVSILSWRRF